MGGDQTAWRRAARAAARVAWCAMLACATSGCGEEVTPLDAPVPSEGAARVEGGAPPEAAPAEAELSEPTEFLRYVERAEDRGALETAIATYASPDGLEVALIAVVHIGAPDYYSELRRRFEAYDSVLFEMIAPSAEAARRARGGEKSLLARFQSGFAESLGLSFQLDGIDYTAANFVHADMTAGQFARRWEERGESLWKMALRLLSVDAARTSELRPAALFEAVRSPDRKRRLRTLLAREFGKLEQMLDGLDGSEPGQESMLIGERNKAAMSVLRERVAAGDRKLAIFYGAGHMPDFERRLRDMGLRLRSREWLEAWPSD
jgi:hypothetical protein